MTEYFFDTYALMEYLDGNERFAKYFTEGTGITSRLNLMELYYILLRDEHFADSAFASFCRIAVEPSDDDIKEGMRLRRELKAKRLDISYVDAMGYAMARRRAIPFLTGDREFAGMPGVEHVK